MNTELVKLTGDSGDTEKITAAAKILDSGGIVAFPTETVFGLGCRVHPDSIARLDELKGRSSEKRYTLHIAGKEKLSEFVPNISFRGQKLLDGAWPGPLTVVFELSENDLALQKIRFSGEKTAEFDILYQGGTLGVRCPDNHASQLLLNQTVWPIVAPSANFAGQPPATTADQVIENFDGKIEMVIQGRSDDCKCKINSTVVRISTSNTEILRPGAFPENEITDLLRIRILFVCTGNTCRSPMAEAFCRKYLAEKFNSPLDGIDKIGYKVKSAGVMVSLPLPASCEVIEICGQQGIDMTHHQSKGASDKLIHQSDYIFTMTNSHRKMLLQAWPEATVKCQNLDENCDIPDPIGAGYGVYLECAKRIDIALKKRLDEIIV